MRTLIIGNTGYVTADFIKNTFSGDSIVVLGNPELKSDKKLRLTSCGVPMEDENVGKIINGRSFDKIVVFSNYLTFHSSQLGELDRIHRLFHTRWVDDETQLIYLTPMEITGRVELAKAAEKLFIFYAREIRNKMKIIRIPYLYSVSYQEDYLYKIFQSIEQKTKVKLEASRTGCANFISMDDLSELLYRVFNMWDSNPEILIAPEAMPTSFSDLGECIAQIDSKWTPRYTASLEERYVYAGDRALREKYGWAQKYALTQEFQSLYEEYLEKKPASSHGENKVLRWFGQHKVVSECTELLLGCLLMELLNQLTMGSAQFRMVDFRLLFVVITGCVYGVNMGIAAAVLAGLALGVSFAADGLNWMTLLYEPANWLPFAAYLSAGTICGYIRLKAWDQVAYVRHENELLREKFSTLKSLYFDTEEEQKNLKKQIVSSRDSFGKIFEITKRLEQADPNELLRQAVLILEETLENETVVMYSVDAEAACGKLEACSKKISGEAAREIQLRDYAAALEQTRHGEIFFNNELLENYPMYLVEAHGAGQTRILIMVLRTSFEQSGISYTNLLKVVCGLVEIALQRAATDQRRSEENDEKRGKTEQ